MIRFGNIDDLEIIKAFNYNLAKETEGLELDLDRLKKGVENLLVDNKKGTYYLAEIDGEVIGQTMVTKEWSDWRNGEFWWIQSVYVKKAFRGKGVFKSLFKHIEKMALENPNVCGIRLYVEKNNINAMRTYKSHGMYQTDYLLYETEKNS